MPAKSNWVKGQTVTAADLNELAEAANNALSQEDADATYAPVGLVADGITYNGDGTVASST
ncbi:MAG: hypothetical protein DI630_16960, partial [Gordonia sp. (in: high G+C Gram-positive bacteria)]